MMEKTTTDKNKGICVDDFAKCSQTGCNRPPISSHLKFCPYHRKPIIKKVIPSGQKNNLYDKSSTTDFASEKQTINEKSKPTSSEIQKNFKDCIDSLGDYPEKSNNSNEFEKQGLKCQWDKYSKGGEPCNELSNNGIMLTYNHILCSDHNYLFYKGIYNVGCEWKKYLPESTECGNTVEKRKKPFRVCDSHISEMNQKGIGLYKNSTFVGMGCPRICNKGTVRRHKCEKKPYKRGICYYHFCKSYPHEMKRNCIKYKRG